MPLARRTTKCRCRRLAGRSTSCSSCRAFQNLRRDPLECIRTIQRAGLWVTGGFIVGFDADTEDIFKRQVDFIERAAIVCAMTGFLEALPTTPLYERLERQGRLLEGSRPRGVFKPPNFRTRMPLRTLLAGNRQILRTIYAPPVYFARALRSLEEWTPSEYHHLPRLNVAAVLGRSFVKQGLLSSYRREYWRYLFAMVRRWRGQRRKLWLGFSMLIAAHHFLRYAHAVAAELDLELQRLEAADATAAPAFPAGVA